MIKRITITGTESTGKSTLVAQLAGHYKTVYVPDYSRSYIEKLGHKYHHTDVLNIAHGIIEQENQVQHLAHRIFFSDNDLINIKIWLQYYKWHVPDWLEHEIVKRKSPLYLLCDIDIDWQADEQRKNADDRAELLHRFVETLTAINANYVWVRGKGDIRLNAAIQAVDDFIK
ncbi:MAG TPA: ATP-binding protein [Chitinophagales bacterium]|nr:ATP-binding protein [Chitinophagales bacterium]